MSYEKFKIRNSEDVTVGTMYCIGQNYAKHAAEMGSAVSETPMVFIKPPAAYIPNGGKVILPEFSKLVHYELELVVLIGKDCHLIEEEDAYKYIAGYAVGIDVTLRDIQKQAKDAGKPWSVAKGFYTSAPISEFIPQENFGSNIPYFDLTLRLNGNVMQSGNTSEMERSVAQLMKYIAGVFTLRKGDVIFTGTPEGVGAINKGDKIEAELNNLISISVEAE